MFSFFGSSSYAQEDTMKVKSVEQAISISLKDFRHKIINDNVIIYNIVTVDLNEKNIDLATNDLIVENGINARKIDYKTKKFLFKFVISINNGRTFINVIKWRLNKKSDKELEFLNLMSGSCYEVIP